MLVLTVAVMAMLCAFWEAYRIWNLKPTSWFKRNLILIVFVAIWLSPLLLKDRGNWTGTVGIVVYYTIYFVFILNFFYAGLIVVRDFCWIMGWLWRKYKQQPVGSYDWRNVIRVRRSGYMALGLAALLTVYSLYEGTKIPDIRTITIETAKIKSNMTIVALADVHLHRTVSVDKIKRLVERVNAVKPDMIVFVGDMIDDYWIYIQPQIEALRALVAPKGKYAVAGNHEFYVGYTQSKQILQEAGLTYLFNEGVQITPTVYLAGIPDYRTVYTISDTVDIVRALSSAQEKDYKILLSHRPNFIDKLPKGMIDLQLSGHTHGGQIFPGHILAWLQNDYLSGLYDRPNGQLYVSRGAGQWGPQMRLGAPSEITVIRLVSAAKEKTKETEYTHEKQETSSKGMIEKTESEEKKILPVFEDIKQVDLEKNQNEVEKRQENENVQSENTDKEVYHVSDKANQIDMQQSELIIPSKPVLLPIKPQENNRVAEIRVEDILGEPMPEIAQLDISITSSEADETSDKQAFEEAKVALDTELKDILTRQKVSPERDDIAVIKADEQQVENISDRNRNQDVSSVMRVKKEESLPVETQVSIQPLSGVIENRLPVSVHYVAREINPTFETVGSINVLPAGLIEELEHPSIPIYEGMTGYGTIQESIPVYPIMY